MTGLLIGSPYELDFKLYPFKNYKKSQELKPTKKILVQEVKRRCKDYKLSKNNNVNSHDNNAKLTLFLQEHPITNKSCLRFLKTQELQLRAEVITAVENSHLAVDHHMICVLRRYFLATQTQPCPLL